MISVDRTINSFKGIAAGGSFDVLLVRGTEGKITITGEENIIPFIETEINDGILKIKYQKNTNIKTTKKLEVLIYFEEIESVALGGSGNISSKETIKAKDFNVSLGGSGNISLDLKAKEIKVKIGGSGNIELKGTTNELDCAIAGSGNIKAYRLTAKELNATIAGSGSVKIKVKNKIKAKVVGSGNIYYKGKPSKIEIKSVGSGRVIEKN